MLERMRSPLRSPRSREVWAAEKDVDYRTVTVTGRLLNDRERHYFATYDGTSGFTLTPIRRFCLTTVAQSSLIAALFPMTRRIP